jgi:formate hydrogenlyase subunit 6/NADH:ubiquinone oxidoreductase subunit I
VHELVAEAGTERGVSVLAQLPSRPATASDEARVDAIVAAASRSMGRTVDTAMVGKTLLERAEHSRWQHVAERCLACANCTMVCPTCFCTTIADATDLSGGEAERIRTWDSCFTLDFSYVHGGSVRASIAARYRQWLTHKFGTWVEQFGTVGCVGCGRCVTWCPVGIDVTEELAALGATDETHSTAPAP